MTRLDATIALALNRRKRSGATELYRLILGVPMLRTSTRPLSQSVNRTSSSYQPQSPPQPPLSTRPGLLGCSSNRQSASLRGKSAATCRHRAALISLKTACRSSGLQLVCCAPRRHSVAPYSDRQAREPSLPQLLAKLAMPLIMIRLVDGCSVSRLVPSQRRRGGRR